MASGMGFAGWMSLASGFVELMANRDAARATRLSGERAKVASEFNAEELERRAGIVIGLAQRNALEEQRQGDVAASRALAVAAASGASVSDPTMMRIIADTKGLGVLRAQIALYEGEEQARQLRVGAMSERLGGSYALDDALDRARGFQYRSLGTIARTGSTLYAKYGVPGPGSGDSALIRSSNYGSAEDMTASYLDL